MIRFTKTLFIVIFIIQYDSDVFITDTCTLLSIDLSCCLVNVNSIDTFPKLSNVTDLYPTSVILVSADFSGTSLLIRCSLKHICFLLALFSWKKWGFVLQVLGFCRGGVRVSVFSESTLLVFPYFGLLSLTLGLCSSLSSVKYIPNMFEFVLHITGITNFHRSWIQT